MRICPIRVLDRLDHGFRVERQFTGDGAHPQRTPLAIRRMRIDSDLHAVSTEAVGSIAAFALAQEKDIALKGSGAAVVIHGNAEMLHRAIFNLAENAIKFSPTGSTVDVEVAADGELRVRDHGPGIAEAEREVIFQRFWRGDRQRSDGAGLGLSIVRAVADDHGATIGVANQPGGGAEFTLRFQPAPGAGSVTAQGPDCVRPALTCHPATWGRGGIEFRGQCKGPALPAAKAVGAARCTVVPARVSFRISGLGPGIRPQARLDLVGTAVLLATSSGVCRAFSGFQEFGARIPSTSRRTPSPPMAVPARRSIHVLELR